MRRAQALVLAAVAAMGGAAAAQTAPAPSGQAAAARPKCSDLDPAAQGGEAAKTKYEVVTGPDGKKIFRIKTGFVICGKVPKPDVLYGLLNTTINYEWETLKQDFVPKVLKSVEQSPF
jgi:hypothetical protein